MHDAATYAFPREDADLLFSRFGVMFFADPAAAFANLRLAMRPGGRLLCMAWRPLAENPWMSVPLEAARPLLPPQPPPEPYTPGPFAFADAERVRSILAAAGWADANIVRQDMPMRLAGVGQLDEATEYATRVGPLARELADADPDLRSRARQAVREVLGAYEGPNGISLTGSIWLVTART